MSGYTPEVTTIRDGASANRLILRITELDADGEISGGPTREQVQVLGIIGSPEGRSLGSPGDMRIRQDVPQLWQKITGVRTRTGWMLLTSGGGVMVCDAIPATNVAGSTGSAGVLPTAARCDHAHPVPVSSPAPLTVGQASGPGVATTFVRADHAHATAAAAPVTATGTTNSAGVAASFVRSDHLHRIEVEGLDDGAAIGARPRLNFTGTGVTVVDNGVDDRLDIAIPGAAAATWAATLATGNVSGGTDAVMTAGDDLAGEDEAAATGGVIVARAGDHTGGGATADDGGAATYRAGDTNATAAGANGGGLTVRAGDHTDIGAVDADGGDALVRAGDTRATGVGSAGGAMTLRAGDSSGSGLSIAGDLTCRAGNATTGIGGAAEFAAGDIATSGNTGGTATLRGGDNTVGTGLANGTGGPVLVRGGDSPSTGAVRNGDGGNLNLRGGNYRTGIAGTPASAGAAFMRSGQIDSTFGSTGGTSGFLRITTDAINAVGDMPGVGGVFTDTGNIQIDTTGQGATANSTGNITITCGTPSGSGFSGISPGEVTISSGGMLVTTQAGVGGGDATFNAGDSEGTSTSPGGNAIINAGDQIDAGADGGSPGGDVELNAGDSAKTSATSGGGNVISRAGDGATGDGGTVQHHAGVSTTGDNGTVQTFTDDVVEPLNERTLEFDTTDATPIVLTLTDLPAVGDFVGMEVYINAQIQDGVGASFFSRKICTAFFREVGAVTEITRHIDSTVAVGAAVAWTGNVVISGTDINLSIIGAAATTIDWSVTVEFKRRTT